MFRQLCRVGRWDFNPIRSIGRSGSADYYWVSWNLRLPRLSRSQCHEGHRRAEHDEFCALFCEVEKGNARDPERDARASCEHRLSTFGKRGAQVALPQSPILRDCQKTLGPKTERKNEKESVTRRAKSVTYVLNQECYRCPDCAEFREFCILHSKLCICETQAKPTKSK